MVSTDTPAKSGTDERPVPAADTRLPDDPQASARALEAILFLVGEPITPQELAKRTGMDVGRVLEGLEVLDSDLRGSNRGLRLVRAPEGVQLATAPEHGLLIDVVVKSGMREQLTPAAAETLAIIAYRGPIHRAGLEAIRGVNSSFTLRHLAIRGLVARQPSPKDSRVYLYEVSAEFLRHLGVTSVQELPQYGELHTEAQMTALERTAEGTVSSPASPPVPSESSPPA